MLRIVFEYMQLILRIGADKAGERESEAER